MFYEECLKFVGFRGWYDENRIPHLERELKYPNKNYNLYSISSIPPIIENTSSQVSDLEKNQKKIVKSPYTGLEIEIKEYPGEAFPPPIDASGKYLGILYYEAEIMTLMFMVMGMYGHRAAMAILMPRGHGKTYIEDYFNGMMLKYFGYNVMLLSVTNARRKVGNWIYKWSNKQKYLDKVVKGAKQNTYNHFELTNGSRLDIYDYMSEELVGEHNYIIVFDDFIKKDWQRLPGTNEKAREQFQSNINFIIRIGLFAFGTRKFEGDPLQYLIETIEDIVVIKMSPFVECPHGNKNKDGTFDPCPICRDECLLAPELHTYDGLMKKMVEDYESWYSEMMQNPHPMEGGMVDKKDLGWVNERPFFTDVQMCGIAVDSTESDLDSNDMCGITMAVMGTKDNTELKIEEMEITFLDADVRKMPFRSCNDRKGVLQRGIMETIGEMVKFLELNYAHIPIIIAIERKGGGIFIIKEARTNAKEYWWHKYIIGEKDKGKKYDISGAEDERLGINHSEEKVARVFSELRFPIKKQQVKFLESLYGSEFMVQLLSFPKGRHDDGPDSAGMLKSELAKRWHGTKIKPRDTSKQEHDQKEAFSKNWELATKPWLREQERGRRLQSRLRARLTQMGFKEE